MKIKFLTPGFLLVLIAPFVFFYGLSLDKAGSGTWGWLIELIGAICVWIGAPMMIYGQLASLEPSITKMKPIKIKRDILLTIAVLSCGYLSFKWSSQIASWLKEPVGFGVNEDFIVFWGILGMATGSISLVINILVWSYANARSIYLHLRNLPFAIMIIIKLRKTTLRIVDHAEKHWFRLSKTNIRVLALNVLIVLIILPLPGLGWFRWIALLLSLWIFRKLGALIGYQTTLEQIGRTITPILALCGLIYGYFLTDPLSSAISNSFGVFFLFFSFNVPKLILQKDNFFERFLFSLICGFVAFGGNIFMGATLSVLESIRNGASYSVLGDKLMGALGPAILALLGFLAAELFCDAPLLQMRGVSNYSYEKASGSLFYLSFFLGFGGNRIISPLLFFLSFLLIVRRQKPTTRLLKKLWSEVGNLRNSLVGKFMDTSVDQKLVTEGILNSTVIAMLNFRFLGHTQMEPVHYLIILVQCFPLLLFLFAVKRFLVLYTISGGSLIATGLAGLAYIRSWPFGAFMIELSRSLTVLFSSTGVGEVPTVTFLSWIVTIYLMVTLSVVVSIPIDHIRRKMETAFAEKCRDGLRKLYRSSILIMLGACILFALCLYPTLLEYYPTFSKLEGGELINYDLFWVFFILFNAMFALPLLFSRYELSRPIELLKEECNRF